MLQALILSVALGAVATPYGAALARADRAIERAAKTESPRMRAKFTAEAFSALELTFKEASKARVCTLGFNPLQDQRKRYALLIEVDPNGTGRAARVRDGELVLAAYRNALKLPAPRGIDAEQVQIWREELGSVFLDLVGDAKTIFLTVATSSTAAEDEWTRRARIGLLEATKIAEDAAAPPPP